MGAGNVEFTAYSHATAAKKLLRSGSLVSRRTNGLPAEELEALSERGCRATAGSYRTDEKNCSRTRLVELAELFIELYRPASFMYSSISSANAEPRLSMKVRL